MRYCFDFNQEFFFSIYLLIRETISSRFLRSSLYDSFERCCEELCFLFGQPVREVLSYSPGINWPGVPERCNPFFGDHGICTATIRPRPISSQEPFCFYRPVEASAPTQAEGASA